ncbi:hypothetical protein M0R45_008645 [Rubus argutus]|uniref:Cell division cycle protein 123 homolog n=1 Tax=Rubus argutus TaxID=59490 RepID=A0AAW1Y4Q6_RUBAR
MKEEEVNRCQDTGMPSLPPSFPELELEIKESIASLGGAVFPKLNWSAPKDSAWISTIGTLRCSTFSEIALLLRSSDSLVHDLCHAYDSCSDKTSSRPKSFFIALRKMVPIPSARDGIPLLCHGFQPLGCIYTASDVTWEELEQNENEQGDGVEFRIVESQCGVRPGLKTAVPYDYVDTSSGSGWDQFFRNADEELQLQTRSPEAGA